MRETLEQKCRVEMKTELRAECQQKNELSIKMSPKCASEIKILNLPNQ